MLFDLRSLLSADGSFDPAAKVNFELADLASYVTTLTDAPPPGGRVNFDLTRVTEYQVKALALLPAFKPGRAMPEFEVMLTGPGPVWLFLALAAALHSRGGPVVYSAPNAPRVVVIDHK